MLESLGFISCSSWEISVSHKVVSGTELFGRKLLLPLTLFMGKTNLAVRTGLI